MIMEVKHRMMRGLVVFGAVFLGGFSLLPIDAFADPGLDFSVVISDVPILEINLSDANGSAIGATTTMDVVPDHGTAAFNEKNMVVSVGTNNEWGYNLNMNVSNTVLTSQENSNNTIANLASKAGGYTCSVDTAETCDFTVNSWGYKIASATNISAATNYLPVVSSVNLNHYNNRTNGDLTYVSFGSKVNTTLAPGTYSTTINFVATANPDPTPIMQNVSASDLASLMPSDGNITTLKDSRDNNKYQITNINGTYWMTDNLKIMGTISASESNFTGADFNISAGGDLTAGDTYTEPRAHFNTSDTNSSTYGAYYNYCAASAGTVCSQTKQDATSDICPKGWRLPTQTEITTIKNNNGTNFNPVLAGNYYSGSLRNASSLGGWWSATASGTSSQYDLGYNGSSWYVDNYGSKYYGFSVRCVHGPLPTMQNVTSTKLASLIPNNGDTMVLSDERDDTKYTIGRLADGKVWMLDNLALDLTNSTTLNNTTASNTNASATSITSLKSGNRAVGDQYATAGVSSNWNSSYSFSAPLIDATSKDTTQPLAVGQSGTGKVGIYYNYCAASAGSYCYGNGTDVGSPSGNATEDICPKGWRMPTGGSSSGDYQTLYVAYSSNDADYVNALKMSLSGYFDGSSAAISQGSWGFLWSSTNAGAYNMYILVGGPSYVRTTGNTYTRRLGVPIRCLFGS